MMRMTFFWGVDLGEFFFPGLQVNSAGGLVIACGVIALFAVLYESIKVNIFIIYNRNMFSIRIES